ncbi:MAG: nicotinate-nucleotide adenylyltransferase [Chloroflexota bacterium]
MKIGVLGGTFDPVHIGHIKLAEAVMSRLDLACILFVPAGRPYLKMGQQITPAEHRLAMVRLAVAGHTELKVATMEIDRPGPSYTVETIADLKNGLHADDEIFFIMGWDILAELPRWREPLRLIQMCRLVAVPRMGYPIPDTHSMDEAIPGLSRRVMVLGKPVINISATVIRERVARGLSIRHLVPEAVDKYIKEHGLYQEVVGKT